VIKPTIFFFKKIVSAPSESTSIYSHFRKGQTGTPIGVSRNSNFDAWTFPYGLGFRNRREGRPTTKFCFLITEPFLRADFKLSRKLFVEVIFGRYQRLDVWIEACVRTPAPHCHVHLWKKIPCPCLLRHARPWETSRLQLLPPDPSSLSARVGPSCQDEDAHALSVGSQRAPYAGPRLACPILDARAVPLCFSLKHETLECNIDLKVDETFITYTWNICVKHTQHPDKNTYNLQHENPYCNIRLKWLKYFEHMCETYATSRPKHLQHTFINRWNILNKSLRHVFETLATNVTSWSTFATSMWTTCNIHLKYLKRALAT
jgi:hypothetical protein